MPKRDPVASVYIIECITPGYYYVGATEFLARRILEHVKSNTRASHITRKHGIKDVIFIKHFATMQIAKIIESVKVTELRKQGLKAFGGGRLWEREGEFS